MSHPCIKLRPVPQSGLFLSYLGRDVAAAILSSLSCTLMLALPSWIIYSVLPSILEKSLSYPTSPSKYSLIFPFPPFSFSKPWDQFLYAASIFLFSLKLPSRKPSSPLVP